jgi:sialidase-1
MYRYILFCLFSLTAISLKGQQVLKADEWKDYERIYLKPKAGLKKILPYADYLNTRAGLNNFFTTATRSKKATVAFLGGSITYNPGWRQFVCSWLKARFPGTEFRFIAAGIPSLGSLPHVFRLQRDVLDSGKIDLLLVEAAVNDRVNGTDSLTQIRDLEGIIRHAKTSNPLMDIIMLSFADPDKNNDYDKGIIPVEIANQELIAQYYHLPSANPAKEVHDKLRNHEFSWEDDFKDLHPAIFGQVLYFETIKQLLSGCFDLPVTEVSRGQRSDSLPAALNKASFQNGSYAPVQNAVCDSQWTLQPDWVPADKLPTRDGFVHIPVLSATRPGSELSLSFKGTAIGMAVLSGADAGIISYAIDGGPFRETDLFTQWSALLHLPWYVLFDGNLKKGSHVLRIRIAAHRNANSKGNACRIVYFLNNS